MSQFSFLSQSRGKLWVALVPILFLLLLLSVTVYLFGSDATGGAVQIALLGAAALTAATGVVTGTSWRDLEEGVKKSMSEIVVPIFILLMIGALAGTWILSGIVPTIICYGLHIINPKVFLFVACIVSSIVAVVTGSSWSTVATVGIALLGIGKSLGISEEIVAGAIISGAYFGDKMSPLSDTTNLAAAVSGVPLFRHIRYMLYTTVPSIVLSLLVFLCIGIFGDVKSVTDSSTGAIVDKIEGVFAISSWLLVVPFIVLLLIMRGTATLPALFIGTVLGCVTALIAQPHLVAQIGNEGQSGTALKADYLFKGLAQALSSNVSYQTGDNMVNELLATSGMGGMLNTVWLILCATAFGGMMQATGFLERISAAILSASRKVWSLVASTAGTCIFFNTTSGDQYLSIIIPGKMFREGYRTCDLKAEALSRTLEDSATVTSVLIPWNTCGATQASVLGVATFAYAPFCFFNLISPVMTLIFAIFREKSLKN